MARRAGRRLLGQQARAEPARPLGRGEAEVDARAARRWRSTVRTASSQRAAMSGAQAGLARSCGRGCSTRPRPSARSSASLTKMTRRSASISAIGSGESSTRARKAASPALRRSSACLRAVMSVASTVTQPGAPSRGVGRARAAGAASAGPRWWASPARSGARRRSSTAARSSRSSGSTTSRGSPASRGGAPHQGLGGQADHREGGVAGAHVPQLAVELHDDALVLSGTRPRPLSASSASPPAPPAALAHGTCHILRVSRKPGATDPRPASAILADRSELPLRLGRGVRRGGRRPPTPRCARGRRRWRRTSRSGATASRQDHVPEGDRRPDEDRVERPTRWGRTLAARTFGGFGPLPGLEEHVGAAGLALDVHGGVDLPGVAALRRAPGCPEPPRAQAQKARDDGEDDDPLPAQEERAEQGHQPVQEHEPHDAHGEGSPAPHGVLELGAVGDGAHTPTACRSPRLGRVRRCRRSSRPPPSVRTQPTPWTQMPKPTPPERMRMPKMTMIPMITKSVFIPSLVRGRARGSSARADSVAHRPRRGGGRVERPGPGGPTRLQNEGGGVHPRPVGSTPTPLRPGGRRGPSAAPRCRRRVRPGRPRVPRAARGRRAGHGGGRDRHRRPQRARPPRRDHPGARIVGPARTRSGTSPGRSTWWSSRRPTAPTCRSRARPSPRACPWWSNKPLARRRAQGRAASWRRPRRPA